MDRSTTTKLGVAIVILIAAGVILRLGTGGVAPTPPDRVSAGDAAASEQPAGPVSENGRWEMPPFTRHR